MAFFDKANKPTIKGGHFANVLNGDAHFHTHYGPESESSLQGPAQTLLRNVAAGAFHDAAERSDPPKCHPETRMAIRNETMRWIKDSGVRKQFIVWLYGPAGSGKSAIAQTIAELCEQEKFLVASFFFSRTGVGRNDTARFASTLAYQLSLSIPEIRRNILAAVEKEPLIFSRSLHAQLQTLIIAPVNDAVASGLIKRDPREPRLVVVDGLDEAREESSQTELLEALATCITQLRLPLIFIVASRPEYAIRQSFNKDPLQTYMLGLPLDEHYKPDDDIRIFLQSKFGDIRQSHPSGSSLPIPWPDEDSLEYVVDKSSGQFIYASTVVKYVASPRHNPTRRLKIIRGLSTPGRDTPFAQLDTLYDFILSHVDEPSRVLDILALLFLNAGYETYLTVDFIEELLDLDPGDVPAALTDMHALVHVPSLPEDGNRLRLYHASLHDFLMDKSRTTLFFLNGRERHTQLGLRLFRYITDPSSDCMQDEDRYVCLLNGFIGHFREAAGVDELMGALNGFSVTNLLASLSLEAIYSIHWDTWFERLRENCHAENLSPLKRLRDELDDWIGRRLRQYPPIIQDCISATFAIPKYMIADVPDIFEIVTHALPLSDAARTVALDRNLFQLLDISAMNIDINHQAPIHFHRYFVDSSRSGVRFADGTKFATLAKQFVEVLCIRVGSDLPVTIEDRPHELERSDEAWCRRLKLDHADLGYFSTILSNATEDVGLARMLWDHVILSKLDDEISKGRKNMAIASFQYIKRCGVHLPAEDHIQSHSTGCQICAQNSALMNERFAQLEATQDAVTPTSELGFPVIPTTPSSQIAGHAAEYYNQPSAQASSSSYTSYYDETRPSSSMATSTFTSMSRQSLHVDTRSMSPSVKNSVNPSSSIHMPQPLSYSSNGPSAAYLSAPSYGYSTSTVAHASMPSLRSSATMSRGLNTSAHRASAEISFPLPADYHPPASEKKKPFWKRMFHSHR